MLQENIKLDVTKQAIYKKFFAGKDQKERQDIASSLVELNNSAFAHFYTTHVFAALPENKKLAVSFMNEAIMALNLNILSNAQEEEFQWSELEIPYMVYNSIDSTREFLKANSIVKKVYSLFLSNSYKFEHNTEDEDSTCFMLMDFYEDIFMQCWFEHPVVQHNLHKTLKPSIFPVIDEDDSAEEAFDLVK